MTKIIKKIHKILDHFGHKIQGWNTPSTPKLKPVLIAFKINRFYKTPVQIVVKHVLIKSVYFKQVLIKLAHEVVLTEF